MTNHLRFLTTALALAAFEAQGSIAPGTEGFWKVWGATPHTVRPGDLVLTNDADGSPRWDLILDLFEARAAPMRVGVLTEEGKVTFGALAPIQVLRWGTKNTLA